MNLIKIKSYSNVIILLSSNIFLILAISFSGTGNPNQKSVTPKNHLLLLLPIEIFVPLNEDPEGNFVTLYDEMDQIVIKRAKIHSEKREGGFNESNLRLIEIEDKELMKIINSKGKAIRAFPFVENLIKRDLDNYEFNF